ncbi:MAG TPA: hypothetical protein V6D15_15930 [Oculatellaceae cyanobacterium]
MSPRQIIPFRRLCSTDLANVLNQQGLQNILENPTVVSMAQGSPGEASAHYEMLSSIPSELLTSLVTPPNNTLDALSLALQIDQTLEFSQQLWLLDYLQHLWWHSLKLPHLLKSLLAAKEALLKLAQPRLVWEVNLLNL